MNDGAAPRKGWWRAHELEINLGLALISLALLVVSIVLGNGVLAGLSFLLLVFFSIYTVYAYFRRDT
jgi:hypothetical protein